MKEEVIALCEEHSFEYEACRNWCDCVDYTDFILIYTPHKTFTFYCLDNGQFRLNKQIVTNIDEVKEIIL